LLWRTIESNSICSPCVLCVLLFRKHQRRIALKFEVLTELRENYRPNDDLLSVIYHNEQYPAAFYTFPLSGITNEINNDFIKEVGEIIKPGGSGLFLLIAK
jgi:hypothetical protein